MSSRKLVDRACKSIRDEGILLVFPIDNRPEFPSLWSKFWPRSEMRWEWDDNGDNRVAQLWHLREELSRTEEVVYVKWFRDRATFFSREVFAAMLSQLGLPRARHSSLSRDARNILEILELDSPLSTKQLKRAADLQGRAQEGRYHRALKELWSRLLIVVHGEVDEGAFPSLAIGATRLLRERIWEDASALSPEEAEEAISRALPEDSPYLAHYRKTLRALAEKPPAATPRFI